MKITVEYKRGKSETSETLDAEIPDTMKALISFLGERRCIYLLQECWREGLQRDIQKACKKGADREYLEQMARDYFPGADMPPPPAETILALTEENLALMTDEEFKRLYNIVREDTQRRLKT